MATAKLRDHRGGLLNLMEQKTCNGLWADERLGAEIEEAESDRGLHAGSEDESNGSHYSRYHAEMERRESSPAEENKSVVAAREITTEA